MPTERSIPAGVVRELDREHSPETILVFLTIDHISLSEPIRVVSDPKDHVYGGETYTGFEFRIDLLSDTDRPPVAQLSVQNVNRQIGAALKRMTTAAKVSITVIAGSEFNQAVDPRTEIGTAAVMYTAADLQLRDVEVSALTVTGTLKSRDFSREQWPSIMATQDRFPGLYR